MIPIDFEYHRPKAITEALKIYQELTADNKAAVYYGGGTELISRSRVNEITPQAMIDLKNIPECNIFKKEAGQIVIGSTVSLTAIADTPLFPLLSNVVKSIAFRTARNKITIGGNLAGDTFYREAILPLLLLDSKVVLAGEKGIRQVDIQEIAGNGMKLAKDEFIVQILINEKYTEYPYFNHKTTKQSKVNYPIVSLAAIEVDDSFRIAFSGVCPFPFRLKEIEDIMNNSAASPGERTRRVIDLLPSAILNDMHASREYREFVLKQSLCKLLEHVEGRSS